MAHVVIWAVIFLTAAVVWNSQLVSSDIVTNVDCNKTDSTISLNLAGIDPRPRFAFIYGAVANESCNHSISDIGDTIKVPVTFSSCGVEETNKTFELFLVHQAEYVSGNDTVVWITCTDVNVGTVHGTARVDKPFGGSHNGESEATAVPTGFRMSFAINDVELTTAVKLGAPITLKLMPPADVNFDVTRCTVESFDVTGNKRLGPYGITDGWCSTDKELLTNFEINNIRGKTIASTVKAFRLVGQGIMQQLTFKCHLKWCSSLAASTCVQQGITTFTLMCQFVDKEDAIFRNFSAGISVNNNGCTTPSNRRRRRQVNGYGVYINDETLTASLRVDIPGISTSGANHNGYIIQLAVLVFCSLKCIV